ncbi:aminotransferase class V-fold PLP-dependent enzyme [Idiomarina sp. HP20-50]|uniref:aminotransferase class V-fold PLP-dependent enzyme n=1 Tax=Idiomarina sp. HP20-50 TaxID=3070813 RepID=UPI00294AFFFC|nr:aminotransferase class V-fold PLP-dependent enzyme [Idiomarina sp. HP20-50]MDV6316872.1 aminotransferase class V-fold PLP-dependent enzyme [Idiomarina sp. HP20-50]
MKPVNIQANANELYLDCNATTPVLPEIIKAVSHTMETVFGNPSSSHITGLRARYILDTTRQLARKVIGLQSGRLIFTSGATEGIQTAVVSAIYAAMQVEPTERKSCLLYGATEHKAVPQALAHWNQLLGLNAELVAIPVDKDGLLDTQFISEHVKDAAMICTMAVNNETGVVQDLKELEHVIRQHNADVPWMVDCVQVLGKKSLNLDETTIDYAPFSGHKLYGPKGIGFMAVRDSAPYTPLIIGGGQESGQRSGTENLPGIAALNALFELLLDENSTRFQSEATLQSYRSQLVDSLTCAFPSIVFNHDLKRSVPTTLNFSVGGVASRDIMDVFDACQIRVSSGSACSSKVTKSFVLDAMGLEEWRSGSAIRLSFGPATQQSEINEACVRIKQASDALRDSCLIVADTNNDNDFQLDGVVQLKYDDHCCYLVIDRKAKEIAVIDPHPALAGRIENIVNCQGYRVKAVVSTVAESAMSESVELLAPILIPLRSNDEYDVFGWSREIEQCDVVPVKCEGSVSGCISIGERCLFRIGSRNPFYILSESAAFKSRVHSDFLFTGTEVSKQAYECFVSEETLICPGRDPEHHIAYTSCELRGDCGVDDEVNIPIGDTDEFWHREDLLIIDVRERQEHVLSDIPCCAEVINVPLTEVIQFIQTNRHLRGRDIICLCRSGNRSQVVANVLKRHGFNSRHLLGGLALLQSPAA